MVRTIQNLFKRNVDAAVFNDLLVSEDVMWWFVHCAADVIEEILDKSNIKQEPHFIEAMAVREVLIWATENCLAGPTNTEDCSLTFER
ncbi:hypothetical protein Nepgr_003748 [Nepenthes gracilis]|uniref:Uncharacterized protein n=1 Tax=Nepenthes gracilis TaxID=150966 RepID=A0AAD3S084_NEPGR|nr:hypothetical protein Nepgr_003748 [Nepenthes gracilis]